jgi:hypothetical protein
MITRAIWRLFSWINTGETVRGTEGEEHVAAFVARARVCVCSMTIRSQANPAVHCMSSVHRTVFYIVTDNTSEKCLTPFDSDKYREHYRFGIWECNVQYQLFLKRESHCRELAGKFLFSLHRPFTIYLSLSILVYIYICNRAAYFETVFYLNTTPVSGDSEQLCLLDTTGPAVAHPASCTVGRGLGLFLVGKAARAWLWPPTSI